MHIVIATVCSVVTFCCTLALFFYHRTQNFMQNWNWWCQKSALVTAGQLLRCYWQLLVALSLIGTNIKVVFVPLFCWLCSVCICRADWQCLGSYGKQRWNAGNWHSPGTLALPSVLWCCWLGSRKGIQPVKNWAVGCRLAYSPAHATATHCLLLQ